MINNTQEIIDSRDIIARIEELESELADLTEEIMEELELESSGENYCDIPEDYEDFWDIKDELDILRILQDQGEMYSDWDYGATLIHEDYFVEYCEELCKDIGDIPSNLPWYINNHIDWEGVAEEIKMDYTELDFDGVTYFIRSC